MEKLTGDNVYSHVFLISLSQFLIFALELPCTYFEREICIILPDMAGTMIFCFRNIEIVSVQSLLDFIFLSTA